MAVNKRKVLETARKYAQKGAKQKALKEYQTLLKLDPRDAKLRLEIGDAHRRWGENEEAIGYYTKVADQYQSDGFDARAVAVYKQILNLDPKRYVAYVALSDLYQRMGLDAEALAALQSAADGYHKEGKKREALELLRKMAQLDPTNTTSRLKVAELLQAEGLTDEAAQEFEAVAQELAKQGEPAQSEKIYERVLEVAPGRADVLVTLARKAIELREPERAEGYAKRAVATSPDEHSLEVLCDVYKVLGRTDELVDATRQLAKIHRDRGDEDTARTIMQRMPVVGTIGGASETSEVSDLGAAGERTEDTLIEDDELLGDDELLADDGTDVFELGGADLGGGAPLGEPADAIDLDTPELELDEAVSDAPTAADDDATPTPQGDPEQLLAESSVYLRYGKTDQAVASLRAVLAQEPGHRSALEKLGEALCSQGDEAGAVEMWSTAAERAHEEDDGEGLDVLRARIAELDADAAAALAARFAAEAAPEPDADDTSDEPLFSDADVADVAADVTDTELPDEIEIDLDLDGSEDATDEVAAHGESGDGGDSTTTAQQVKADLEEAEFFFEQGMYDEAGAIYERILAVAPNHPSALLRIGEIAAARAAEPEDGASAKADPGTTLGAGDLAEDDTESDADSAVADDVAADEIDLDIDLDPDVAGADASEPDETDDATPGAMSEPTLDPDELAAALAAARKGARGPKQAPAVAAARDDSDVIELDGDDGTDVDADTDASGDSSSGAEQTQPLAAANEPASEPEPATFDLAAELSDALSDEDPNESSRDGRLRGTEEEAFTSLFEDFKRGVSQTLDEGDYETRYDLAIAYKEMGLLEDAISAFQVCVASPSRALDSLQLMAQCQLEVGRPSDAIGHLQQALSTENLPTERRAGLNFDLGRAFAANGEVDRARTTFENVSELDPSFPGVREAVAALLEQINESSQDRLANMAADADDAFETFDDLVADAQAEQAATKVASEQGAASEPEAAFVSFDDVIEEAEHALAGDEAEAAEPAAAQPEPELEPEPEPETPKKRKKKISFV